MSREANYEAVERMVILTKKFMLQGYNESRLVSSFRKFCGRCDDLVCDYKVSLANILNDLYHTLSWTVVSMLALTTGDPVYLASTGGAQRM
jgi:hypothetical protein